MKIVRFLSARSEKAQFGIVIQDFAVSFDVLQDKSKQRYSFLANSDNYLANLPESEQAAGNLHKWGIENIKNLEDQDSLDSVQLLEPIRVSSLFDAGLTPRHLENAVNTMFRHEGRNTQIIEALLAMKTAIEALKSTDEPGSKELGYYRANMNSVVGDGQVVPWPKYISRLDVEPELAFVYGNEIQPVAGYCIFNDISARDVQVPDMVSGAGFCRSKDMRGGNQIGPYLVTADEVGNPFNLAVEVKVNGNLRFNGSTSEITGQAEDIYSFLLTFTDLKPGSVMAFGTIPDTCCLDNDGPWIDPGDKIDIIFEKLGTLSCRFGLPEGKLLDSRWQIRPELETYHSPVNVAKSNAAWTDTP